MTWTEAENEFGRCLMPLRLIAASVGNDLPEEEIRRIMDLVPWRFAPCTNLYSEAEYHAPVDWFRMLNEFNGSSAGNTAMESIFQGACELVERHVCARISANDLVTPGIDPSSFNPGPLQELFFKFTAKGIKVILKDFSLDMPVPTVGAAAYDPKTFPDKSEIVFTAGTAASPDKAAIRALTEVAQLAGDFESGRPYEPSGLPKLAGLEELDWLRKGGQRPLNALPDISSTDFGEELRALICRLGEKGFYLHVLELTCPELNIPAHYNFVPGFEFRERSPSAGVGMFTAKKIAAELPVGRARQALNELARIRPSAPYIPFQSGMIALREGDTKQAQTDFLNAAELQENPQEQALALFYAGYAQSLEGNWPGVREKVTRALDLDCEVKEYHNLLGVALFKEKKFSRAAVHFQKALELDSASAVDMANLGLCHKNMDAREEAISCLSSALQIDPGLEFAHKELLELL
ncbi:MAG: YcaO-like family protein [Desulfonatronovibrionaceae bacterium]